MSDTGFFRRIVALKDRYSRAPGLPFADVLRTDRLEGLLRELGVAWRDRIYTPCVTLWTFLSQVLSADHSCSAAVARLLAFRQAQGQKPCSADTASYCQARRRLPEALLARLLRQTGREARQQTPASWHWRGRRVKIIDGTTVSMPDTPANTKAFGKPANQRGSAGFPLARLLVVLCLATGTALEAAIGPCRGKNTGELALLRELDDAFDPGDVLLGDRLFCSYADMARLRGRGVDVVFRLHASRRPDFRRGRRLGRDDHVVTWHKPRRRPEGIPAGAFEALPARVELREVRIRAAGGCRGKTLVVVTTLLDSEAFPASAIATLFRQRWHAELDLRSIKVVLGMDVLRCRTPEMVRKEIWVHLLAYNLLRSVVCAAAAGHGLSARELSFKGALQLVEAFYTRLVHAWGGELGDCCTSLLAAVCQHRVGRRPDRYEPRKRKRAAKPYPRLKLPREKERKKCRRNHLN